MSVVGVVVVVTYPVFVGDVAQLVVTGGNGVARRSVATVVLGVGVGQTVLLVIAKVLLLAEGVIPIVFRLPKLSQINHYFE